MAIFMGCVYVYVLILTFVGPEFMRKSFEVIQDEDMAIVAGHETIEAALARTHHRDINGSDRDDEKVAEAAVETTQTPQTIL